MKKVPWAKLQEYVEAHQGAIVTYIDLEKRKLIDIPEIESKLPKSFLQLYQIITQILRDNDILPQ